MRRRSSRYPQHAVGLLVVCGICILSNASAQEAGSTASIDSALILEQNKEAFYDAESRSLVLNMLRATLPNVPADEKQAMRQRIRGFVKWGFRENNFEERFLFSAANSSLRKVFLDIVQGSEFRLTSEFLEGVYTGYGNRRTAYSFDAFIAPSWETFCGQVANERTYEALSDVLKRSADGDPAPFLNTLHHAYKSHPGYAARTDNAAETLLIKRLQQPQRVQDLYGELQTGHWKRLKEKRNWLQAATAYRTYESLAPEQWAQMPQTVLGLAKSLDQAADNPDWEQTSLSDWFVKLGKVISKTPENAELRELLCHFIENSGLARQRSYSLLRPFFEDNQTVFLALHASPPKESAMELWHVVDENFKDSLRLIEQYLALPRAGDWKPGLWTCLMEFYYAEREWDIQDRVFKNVMTPLLKAENLENNPVRRHFLHDVHQSPAALNAAHRFSVAHHLISTKKMTDTVYEKGGKENVLRFVVETVVDLTATDEVLFKAPELKASVDPLPRSDPERILSYVDHGLGNPLRRVCHALMGNREKTRGVTFSFLEPDGETETPAARQFENMLRRIVQLKNLLKDDYDQSLPKIGILEQMEGDIVRALKEAIAGDNSQQIVTVVRVALKITSILEDDRYLERILVALRDDVFGVADAVSLKRPDQATLKKYIQHFETLDSKDLVDALESVGKAEYMAMFYWELYVPLRSIYGFFEEVGAKPYIEFGDRLTKQGFDALSLFTNDVAALGSMMEDDTPAFIRAEDSVVDLVDHYCDEIDLNLWQSPETLSLNRNVSVPVLQRLLVEEQDNDAQWRPDSAEASELADNYEKVARVFLAAITNAEVNLLTSQDEKSGSPVETDKWDYLLFLNSLVDLHDIYASPVPGEAPRSLYEGDAGKGIVRTPLSSVTEQPRKVNGQLRFDVLGLFLPESLNGPASASFHDQFADIAEMCILLPNCDDNNAGMSKKLEAYEDVKGNVFEAIRSDLLSAESSSDCLQRLIWLCRIECSVGGLGNKEGYDYEEARAAFMTDRSKSAKHHLADADQKRLLFEEFRLDLMNPGTGAPPTTVEGLVPVVTNLVTALAENENYELFHKAKDPFGRLILDLYKEADTNTTLEELKESDLKLVYFLTTKTEDALKAASKQARLSMEERRAAVELMAALYEVHSFFMPYIHGNFNTEAIFKEQLPYALPMFSMLDGSVKRCCADLLNNIQGSGSWPDVRPFAMPASDLTTFLLFHNLLPLDLLETCLEDNSGNRFRRLVRGHPLTITTHNFRTLWVQEETATVSFENVCDEVLAGIDGNRKLLIESRKLTDVAYLEYFFGDMRKVLNGYAVTDEVPRNFDAAIRRIANLVTDDRLKTMAQHLKNMESDVRDDKESERLDKAINDLNEFPRRMETQLCQNAFTYFGGVLATNFSSVFTIQKACEEAVVRVRNAASGSTAEQDSQLDKKALQVYEGFYRNAFLEGPRFNPDVLEPRMAQLFYPAPSNNMSAQDYKSARQRDMTHFLDGTVYEIASANTNEPNDRITTKGLVAIRSDRDASGNTQSELERDYLEAGKRFLRCVFVGEHLPPERPFIGDLLWKKDAEGKRKARALPYEQDPQSIQNLLKWIFGCARKYEDTPEIRNVFAGTSDWDKVNSGPQKQ